MLRLPTIHCLLLLVLAAALSSCARSRCVAIPGSSTMTTVTIRLKPHDDLKGELEAFVRTNDIAAACVITCVASLEKAVLRFANQPAGTILEGKFEVTSLVGTLARDGSHLHLQLADRDGHSVGGHLLEGCRVYTTAEVVVGILPEVTFAREVDATYGYRELVVRPRRVDHRPLRSVVGN